MKHDKGVDIGYKLPRDINDEFLKCNCLYINVESQRIRNHVLLFSFKGINIERLTDGSAFITSNSGIPFWYDGCVTVSLSSNVYSNKIVHILLEPTKEEKLEIKREVAKKVEMHKIINRVEKILSCIIILFLVLVFGYGLIYLRVPFNSTYKLHF